MSTTGGQWRRRELLHGAIAGAATLACPSRATPPIDAAFVGPDPARAHALRDRGLVDGAIGERIDVRVAIVGAGVAGLSAAWRLARAAERDAIVLELDESHNERWQQQIPNSFVCQGLPNGNRLYGTFGARKCT